jgi:hypothetical protein
MMLANQFVPAASLTGQDQAELELFQHGLFVEVW